MSSPQGSDLLHPKRLVVVFDSSVVLQIIVTGQFRILRCLRSEFGVQSAIVPAVESEVSVIVENVPKFRGRREQFKKALRNRTLAIVNRDFLFQFVGAASDSWIRQIDAEGTRLYGFVDRGEAFTHAASIVLNALVATNDTTAVSRLVRMGETVPMPTLRFWDLLVFSHQVGWLSEKDCDDIRQFLHKIGERNHPCFSGHSFQDGLPHFYARLTCSEKLGIGAAEAQEKFDERVVLTRVNPIPHEHPS
ncbi:MAG: hypothetical protein C5B51_26155 [Terriglobia bacterium]|nr:MAG: hypothetical protein C5B51_26155 [Terriglobia bacterium]